MPTELEALKTENARLREALQGVVAAMEPYDTTWYSELDATPFQKNRCIAFAAARAALAGEEINGL